MSKRSKVVMLLAPIALTACSEPAQYSSLDKCTEQTKDVTQCKQERTAGGGFVWVTHWTYAPSQHVPSVRYGFVPGTARGGFGSYATAMHATAVS